MSRKSKKLMGRISLNFNFYVLTRNFILNQRINLKSFGIVQKPMRGKETIRILRSQSTSKTLHRKWKEWPMQQTVFLLCSPEIPPRNLRSRNQLRKSYFPSVTKKTKKLMNSCQKCSKTWNKKNNNFWRRGQPYLKSLQNKNRKEN